MTHLFLNPRMSRSTLISLTDDRKVIQGLCIIRNHQRTVQYWIPLIFKLPILVFTFILAFIKMISSRGKSATMCTAVFLLCVGSCILRWDSCRKILWKTLNWFSDFAPVHIFECLFSVSLNVSLHFSRCLVFRQVSSFSRMTEFILSTGKCLNTNVTFKLLAKTHICQRLYRNLLQANSISINFVYHRIDRDRWKLYTK